MKRLPFLLLTPFSLISAADFSLQWDGEGGDQEWETDTNWTTNTVPCNTGPDTFSAFIGGGAGTVVLDSNCTLQTFELQLGASLRIEDAHTLIVREQLLNGGAITLQGNLSNTQISVFDSSGDDIVQLGGQGTITLDHVRDRITGSYGETLDHVGGHTIEGHGSFGTNSVNLINSGILRANSSGNTLVVDPLSTYSHHGFLIAENGGILRLEQGTYNYTSGAMEIGDGSRIDLSSATMNGGQFSVSNLNGVLSDNAVTVVNSSRLNGFTNDATILVNNGRSLTIGDGDFINNGVITPLGNTANANLSFVDNSGDQSITLSGTGSIVLDSIQDRITGGYTHTLVHAKPHVIEGGGQLGLNTINIVNRSSINSTHGNVPLILDPVTSWINDDGTVHVGAGTQIEARGGSYTCINGGKFLVSDTAELQLSSFTGITVPFQADNPDNILSNNRIKVVENSTLDSSSSECFLSVNNGKSLGLINNDFLNSGIIRLDGSTADASISVSDPSDSTFTLTGPGTVLLDHPERDNVTGAYNHTLIHDTAHTIEGTGRIGRNSINLINRGTITSNIAGQTLSIDPLSTFSNDGGSLTAESNAVVKLLAGTYSSPNGGSYTIDDDGLFELSSVLLEDLTLDVSDLDQDLSNNRIDLLNSSTFKDVVNEGHIHVFNGQSITHNLNSFTNNGLIHLDSTGSDTTMSFSGAGDQVFELMGTGSILLDAPDDDVITGGFQHTLIQQADHSITGSGRIGNNAINVINQGTIEANRAGETLSLDPYVSFVNDGGSVRATNNATILYNPGTYSSINGGSYLMDDGSSFTIGAGVILDQFDLAVSDLDTDLSNNLTHVVGSSTFDGVTNFSWINLSNAQTLSLRDLDFINEGPIHLNSINANTNISINGTDQDLAILGSGTIYLDDPDRDRITGTNAHTLIHGPNHTICGSGRIGLNAINIANQGTIVSDRPGEVLYIDPLVTFSNQSGSVSSSNGGILNFGAGTYSSGGGIYTIGDDSPLQLIGPTLVNLTLAIDNNDVTVANNLVEIPTSSTFKGVTNHASVSIADSKVLSLSGEDFTNHGPIHLDSVASNTLISVNGEADKRIAVTGTGTIHLDDPIRDRITGSYTHTFVQGEDHSIRGSGQVGGNYLYLENHGLISAEISGETLLIDTFSEITNTGTLQAVSGALMDVRDGISDQGGTLFVETGSKIENLGNTHQFDGSTRVDGEFETPLFTIRRSRIQGTGLVDATNFNAYDSAVTPGNSIGTLSFEGDLVFGTGTSTQIEIDSAASHDSFSQNGGFFNPLGSMLELKYGGGPNDVLPSDTLTICTTTGSISGEFINAADGARLNTSDGLASFQVNYGATEIFLTDFVYHGSSVNAAPVFLSPLPSATFAEDLPVGSTVADFDAFDPEGVLIDFSLGINGTPFSINEQDGTVVLDSPLDFEGQTSWVFDIVASDGVNTTSHTFTVNVTNVSDTNQEIAQDLLIDPVNGAFPGETDPAIIGFDADPDRDGRVNVFELWLGTDPATPDQPARLDLQPFAVTEQEHSEMTVEVDSSVDDQLEILVELSFDLNVWRDVSASRTVLQDQNGRRTLRFLDTLPLGPERRGFGRFRAEAETQP